MESSHPHSSAPVGETSLLELETLLQGDPELPQRIRDYPSDYWLVEEGAQQEKVFILLEGEVSMQKTGEGGEKLKVDALSRGNMLGLLSYYARNANFVGALTLTPVRVLEFTWPEFSRYSTREPRIQLCLLNLVRDNLASRYRRMVKLQVELAGLNRTLQYERNDLRATVAELENTRSRLVNQERLAILGQLIAGLAHEINNPAAALLRATAYLEENLGALFEKIPDTNTNISALDLWQEGLLCPPPVSSQISRSERTAWAEALPDLPNSLYRRLAIIPPDRAARLRSDSSLIHHLNTPKDTIARINAVEDWLRPFETGHFLHTISLAGGRIQRLIAGLKSYSRPGQRTWSPVDIAEGLRETLLILGHRLKAIKVEWNGPEVIHTFGDGGELNQVWTNLIVNACDAMKDEGHLYIDIAAENDRMKIIFRDSGPGFPPHVQENLFQPNFTTKNQSRTFGLGLGLSIAKDIIEKHGGTIRADNAPTGGARFHIDLPLVKPG